ncbi:MAG: 16S rRNA (guanine(527)-N(7))-methyltransferase RsmG [Muribaculaceae bacterium]
MQLIDKYFPNLTPEQHFQFEQLGVLYPEWNEKINVISRKDIQNLYPNHILHSLSIAKYIHFTPGTKILDMGSGGGFPGVPLAIMFPDCTFHLVDRIGKKLRVAQDICDKIGLKNVTVQHGDIKEVKGKFDFVVSRAVMRLDELVPLVRRLVASDCKNAIPNGIICLKGGNLDSETSTLHLPIMETPISSYFSEEFFETKKIVFTQI